MASGLMNLPLRTELSSLVQTTVNKIPLDRVNVFERLPHGNTRYPAGCCASNLNPPPLHDDKRRIARPQRMLHHPDVLDDLALLHLRLRRPIRKGEGSLRGEARQRQEQSSHGHLSCALLGYCIAVIIPRAERHASQCQAFGRRRRIKAAAHPYRKG